MLSSFWTHLLISKNEQQTFGYSFNVHAQPGYFINELWFLNNLLLVIFFIDHLHQLTTSLTTFRLTFSHPLPEFLNIGTLTSLVVTPSVIRCRAKMQKTVTPESYSEYRLWNRWPQWGGYSRVAMRRVSRKLTIRGDVSISHTPCLPCRVDLIDTISCSNRCMLTLYCLIGHSIVISRRPNEWMNESAVI